MAKKKVNLRKNIRKSAQLQSLIGEAIADGIVEDWEWTQIAKLAQGEGINIDSLIFNSVILSSIVTKASPLITVQTSDLLECDW